MGLAIDIHRVGKTMAACSPSPICSFGPFEKRGVFVERVIARLQLQRGFTDADLDHATGLIQSAA